MGRGYQRCRWFRSQRRSPNRRPLIIISNGLFQTNQTYPKFLAMRGKLSVKACCGSRSSGRGGCHRRGHNGAARWWYDGGSYRRGSFGGRGCSSPRQASTGMFLSTLIDSMVIQLARLNVLWIVCIRECTDASGIAYIVYSQRKGIK